MKRVELLGPSGVGKTTFYQNIYSNCPVEERSFITHWEAYMKAALSKKVSFKSVRAKVMQLLLKSGVAKQKERGLARKLVLSLNDKNGTVERGDYEGFETSMLLFLNRLSRNPNPYVIRSEINRLVQRIDEYMVLKHYLEDDEIVLFDEGMLHKHGGLSQSAFEHFDNSDFFNDKMLIPDGIISCENSVENVFKQALERRKSGIKTFSHGHLTEDELYRKTEKDVEYHSKMIDRYKSLNIPVLKINPTTDLIDNVNQINFFIEKTKI